MSTIIFQIQSTIILGLLWLGIAKRKKRNLHVKLVSAGIIWDVLLILQIELTRSAIAKASKAMTNPLLLNIHVSLAVSSVLLYCIMVFYGRKLLKGDESVRKTHKFFGLVTITCRTLTYVTSFLIQTGTV